MTCERCKERPATVFFTQVIDGESTQQELCTACAEPMVSRLPGLVQLPGSGWTSYTPSEDTSRTRSGAPVSRPAEVFLPEPVSILDLAEALHIRFDEVVTALVRLGIVDASGRVLDFAAAALVCQHYGVTAHRIA